ncbi:sodium:solute symporter family protein [Fictibacillus sp. WQ 8-8]|uniref:sodium:solute symporter family protein n=1 Tax=unclassified Fictibacillus TaxID=2644029 RepID=UPI00210DC594|nr:MULTISPECIES: sodium:solute symporter family protein [unclassified Fictibacillus]MCQ6267378.1 sodium:solute symporter family protein [Fictibacillus sp. WQ 8-8]MED2974856.1 sodium:solute symporter family protein [Fictibacillus sp. B-59209]
MTARAIIIGMVILYVLATAFLGLYTKKFSKSSDKYMTGGKAFGPFIIGVLMMSEFIGTGSTIGTAQTAFSRGISASWNLITLAFAFALFAYTLAKKFHERGEYTISGAISKTYGNGARTITSVIMIYALSVVNVSMYAGGAATLSAIIHVPHAMAAIVVGVVTVVYVTLGGMFAVAYTNLIHAFFKYLGLILAVSFGLTAAGGFSGLSLQLKPAMFDWTGISWPTIIAWTIANIGSIFSTQYIIQAVCSTNDDANAKKASIYAGVFVIPVGIMAALIGMTASILFPNIVSSEAFPMLTTLMNPFLAGLVISGLIAAVFGTVAASTIGAAALLLKDFYTPLFNKEGSDNKSLRFSRVATIVMGLLPIPFAIFTPEILNTIFFARALRTTIAVIVVLMFYFPRFSSGIGAALGMIFAVITTTFWFLAGNPFGIDNIYIAAVAPLIVMGIDHFWRKNKTVVHEERSNENNGHQYKVQ